MKTKELSQKFHEALVGFEHRDVKAKACAEIALSFAKEVWDAARAIEYGGIRSLKYKDFEDFLNSIK